MTLSNPKSTRRKTLRAWIPDQHGSWPMVIFSPILGASLAGWAPLHAPLLITWFAGYFLFHVITLLAKTPRRRWAALYPPLAVYGTLAAAAGLVTLWMAPRLALWALAFGPLIAAWAVYLFGKQERAWGARTLMIAAGALMLMPAFHAGVIARAAATGGVPGEPGGAAAGAGAWHRASAFMEPWSVAWLLTTLLFAYFWGTIPYVKSLIRERGDATTLTISIGFHLLGLAAAVILAAVGWVSWLLAAAWLLCTARAIALPAYSLRSGQRIRPAVIGVLELFLSFLYLAGLVL